MVLIIEEMIEQFESMVEKIDEQLKKTFENKHQGYPTKNLLVGMPGYSKDGYPIFAINVGPSTLDKTSIDYYVQSHIQINEYRDRVILPCAMKRFGQYIGTCTVIFDMTGLMLSTIYQIIKKYSEMSVIDELNYPEKMETYFIVNGPPYMLSICWKVMNPLLCERTRKKVKILSGSGRNELLKIMDYKSLPHFCREE
ncbi:Hypothetical predicted protein [Olea europaea subsp. europaea]|uniref:CRAL-TRIO domain-containing protein n=1 Tax=Olea europaea subsp. europaea TaxID=158383 RepID=A0A8S0Q3B7_OLEEU|nr:Hypothetical predicted protein [Olea europaea subsp. europaea]